MREIKFRAWNGNRMDYGGFAIHATGNVLIDDVATWIDTPELVVMQFTGLHDKNGVEIYEGDILKGRYSWEIGAVEYGEYEFEYAGESMGEDCNLSMDAYGYHFGYEHKLDPWRAKQTEVIGNIYQNPELLAEGEK